MIKVEPLFECGVFSGLVLNRVKQIGPYNCLNRLGWCLFLDVAADRNLVLQQFELFLLLLELVGLLLD